MTETKGSGIFTQAAHTTLIDLARDEDIAAIDLVGPLLSRLESVLKRKAMGQPGLYRQFHRAYFARVSAIEFTLPTNPSKPAPTRSSS
jgi:regulator of PEP synthase PpsR (kinase-PPPase family)